MNKFQESYEQMLKMNNEIMNNWAKMMSRTPWTAGAQSYTGENWNTMIDRNLDIFLSAAKETKNYCESMEKQLQENWEQLKKTQSIQQEMARKFFENMANFLKKEPESSNQ